MCMMYRIVHDLVAIPASHILKPSNIVTRFDHPYKFVPIVSTKNYYAYSFFPRSVAQWNGLPASVVLAPSLDSFKEGVMAVDFTAIKY